MSKKTKKSVTHVFMIVDKSGSMTSLKTDVIGGFNEYVHSLSHDKEHEYSITAVLFDTRVSRYCEAKAPDDVPALDAKSYNPNGFTALHDAVGFTIGNVTYVNPNDKVLVVIMTDGQENASREETTASVRDKVADRGKQGWEFLYIGQGLDTWAQSRDMGINTYVQTSASRDATVGTYRGLGAGTRSFASGQSVTSAAWAVAEETKDK